MFACFWNDLPQTGVTAMYMSAKMDEGDMIETRTVPIGENETAGELMERLAPLFAEIRIDPEVRKTGL